MRFTSLLKVFMISTLILFVSPVFADDASTIVQDTITTGLVKAKIVLNRIVSNTNVDVSTNNGVVSLSGEVNSNVEETTLIDIAANTSGAKKVDVSKLTVKKSLHPFIDYMTTLKVKAELLRQKLFGGNDVEGLDVNVSTHNGIVYLSGTAKSDSQIENTVAIVQSVSGITKVVSTITVTSK